MDFTRNPMEEAYERLKADWQKGDRDRENSLRLLYYAWMHWAEPGFLTGFDEGGTDDAVALWFEIYNFFGGEAASDAEFLLVASIMADLMPWMLGDVLDWEVKAKRMSARSLELRPEGFTTQDFADRGEYGYYFQMHGRNSGAAPPKSPEPKRSFLDLIVRKFRL